MQFKVPQFIDIEDKVFGPLTFKQFAYLAGGVGLGYLALRWLPIIIGIFLGPVLIGFGLALAFFKYNDKPFIHLVESFIKFYSRSRLYLWHKENHPTIPTRPSTANAAEAMVAHDTLTESNLKTLSWTLDVSDSKK